MRQENSYYPTGLIMANSPVATPTNDNKKLYNGGSEWQKNYGNLPDYYQTFYRNYDAALARWIAVDPEAESAESMTPYQYAGNNPVMMNDPMGNIRKAPQDDPLTYYGHAGGPGNDIERMWMAGWENELGLALSNNSSNVSASEFNTNDPGGDVPAGTPRIDNMLMTRIENGDVSALNTYNEWASAGAYIWSQTAGGIVSDPKEWEAMGGDINKYNAAIAKGEGVTLYAGAWVLNPYASHGGNPFNVSFGNRQDGKGVTLEIYFTNPGYKYASYQWIQTVSSKPTIVKGLHNPHIDGSRRANGTLINYPFYWETSELPGVAQRASINGATSYFGDSPNGQTSFIAEVTLLGISGNGKLTPLGSYSWGYTMNNGVLSPIAPTFSPTPSVFQQNIIYHYNNR